MPSTRIGSASGLYATAGSSAWNQPTRAAVETNIRTVQPMNPYNRSFLTRLISKYQNRPNSRSGGRSPIQHELIM